MSKARRMTTRLVAVLMLVAGLSVVAAAPAQAALADKRNDYNRDGISDIVAVIGDNLWRYYGDSSGGFGGGVQIGGGWTPYAGSLSAVGDINGDGNGDIVARTNSTTNSCLFRWLGNGSGGFGAGAKVGCGWQGYLISGAGDLDNNGAGDILGVNGDCLWRWFGNGSGSFGNGVQLGCGWSPYALTVTGAGDLNGDGNSDIVAINSDDNYLYRWYGNGRGGFGTGTRVGPGWEPYVATRNLAGMGHLNGDNAGDIVSINTQTGYLYAWYGNGAGSFGGARQFGPGWRTAFLAQ